jgi:hypothetical protein
VTLGSDGEPKPLSDCSQGFAFDDVPFKAGDENGGLSFEGTRGRPRLSRILSAASSLTVEEGMPGYAGTDVVGRGDSYGKFPSVPMGFLGFFHFSLFSR